MSKKDVEANKDAEQAKVSRRRFINASAASVATAGATALGFPAIAKVSAPISLRFQSTWPAKDIFHAYAQDFAKKVNAMSGKELKIEVHGKRMLDHDFKPGFKTRAHQKDLNIVMQTVCELGLTLPGSGAGELDAAAVAKIVERMSGMEP